MVDGSQRNNRSHLTTPSSVFRFSGLFSGDPLKTRSFVFEMHESKSRSGFKKFFVVWAHNYSTLYAIPSNMQLCARVDIPLLFQKMHSQDTPLLLFFFLRECAGFLKKFCAEFQVW